MTFGIASVASITVLCYVVGLGVKATKLDDKFIPVIVGFVGIGLGILAWAIKIPDFPAVDVITAAAVGAVSGLASTGANQVYKQLASKEESV